MKAVLTYHSIDSSGSPISVSPATFVAHLAWFVTGRVQIVPLETLARHPADGDDAVAITFDDGFQSIREALAELRAHGLPVTVFVVTRQIGRTNAWGGRDQPGIPTLPLLEWTELERLASRGVALAAHTRTHRPLTQLPDGELEEELAGCADDLERRMGHRPAQVAYPYGDVDARVARAAARIYAAGYTTELRVADTGDDPLRIPRLDAYYFQRPGALEAWGTAAFAARLAWCRAKRRLRSALPGASYAGPR
jgi:peptidoglycan/xylan/chitin deacetylase (PgdA/CDA1 family)